MSLFAELKRRNVIRVAALYVVAAWVILQVAETLFGLLAVPEWAGKLTFALLLLGFPPVLLFSWIFELTPEGLKKQHEVDRAQSITHVTGRRLNYAIGALAVLAIAVVAADRLLPDAQAPGSTATTTDKSIAVLPFLDLSPEKDQEYFTDGISEELLNLLAKIPEMKVIGRTSSFQFKGKNEDLRLIGQKLNAAHLLEGSVRKAGNRIRLTAQLIRADDGTHLWSETYDRTLDDVFAVQDEIAGEVVRALEVTMLGDKLPTPSRTEDPEAHALYLQGQFFHRRRSPGDRERSLEYFEKALERDPEFGAAWVGKSIAHLTLRNAVADDDDGRALLDSAREAALRAIEVDPNLADAYACLADIALTHEWNWQEAARQLERAERLDPLSPRVQRTKASFASAVGNLDEAADLYRALTEQDPLAATNLFNYGLVLKNLGVFSEAERAINQAIELNPDMEGAHAEIANVQILSGRADLALGTLAKESDDFWKVATLPLVLHALGRDAEAETATKALIEAYSDVGAFQIAEVYSFRGHTELALEWLERALAQRDAGLTELAGDPYLKAIKGEPRYKDVVRKVGLPESRDTGV